MTDTRRVALVANTAGYVGPDLARFLAARGHDLVVGDPQDGLVDELVDLGATVEVVTGVHNLANTEAAPTLVEAAIAKFGRIDSAVASSGRIVVGHFLKSGLQDLRAAVVGCIEAPYNFLRAVMPVLVDRGEGQVLVITSASAVRPTPGAPLYSAARAGANMLVRNVADEIAATGVQVNSVGTNFMDFPDFLVASKATTPEGRARVEAQVPMGRLGSMQEFASFCMPYLDGTSRFTTGQFVAYAGGWA